MKLTATALNSLSHRQISPARQTALSSRVLAGRTFAGRPRGHLPALVCQSGARVENWRLHIQTAEAVYRPAAAVYRSAAEKGVDHCVERACGCSPQNVRLKRPRSRPFPVRVGLRGRMRTGPSRTSKSAAPHGYPAGSRVSQRDALHPSTPRCESLGRRRSATANSTLTCRTCAECPP